MFEVQHDVVRHRAVEIRVLGGAIVLWFLVRLTAVAVAVYANLSGMAVGSPVDVSIKTSVMVAIIVTVLSKIDGRRQNVDLLLANLGTSRAATFLLPLAAASFLELIIHILSSFEFIAGR